MTDSREAVHELARHARTGAKKIGDMLYPCAVDGKQVSDMLLSLLHRVEDAESDTAHANKLNMILTGQLQDCSNRLDVSEKRLQQLENMLKSAQAQLAVSDAYAAEDNCSQVPSTWQLQNALIRDTLVGGR